MAALVMSTGAQAEELPSGWRYEPSANLLVVDCDDANMTDRTLSGLEFTPEFASDVQAIWVRGSVETIGSGAFWAFSNVEDLILETPSLQTCSGAFSTSCLMRVYYADPISGAINTLGGTHIAVSDFNELCRVSIENCTNRSPATPSITKVNNRVDSAVSSHQKRPVSPAEAGLLLLFRSIRLFRQYISSSRRISSATQLSLQVGRITAPQSFTSS